MNSLGTYAVESISQYCHSVSIRVTQGKLREESHFKFRVRSFAHAQDDMEREVKLAQMNIVLKSDQSLLEAFVFILEANCGINKSGNKLLRILWQMNLVQQKKS